MSIGSPPYPQEFSSCLRDAADRTLCCNCLSLHGRASFFSCEPVDRWPRCPMADTRTMRSTATSRLVVLYASWDRSERAHGLKQKKLMLDHPEKTAQPLAALKAAAPFEVRLTERLVKYLRAQGDVLADKAHQIVSDLSYSGDEGGIVCHMLPSKEGGGALVVSLTQVHVPRSLPFATAVADHQKHRVKKLKKQNRVN